MIKGTKELHIATLIATIAIFLTGCQSTEEQKTVAESVEPAILTETMKNIEDEEKPQPVPQEEEGFVLHNSREETDVFIPLTDCVCEYESEDFQIYTKYFKAKGYRPDDAAAIYMRTGDDEIQIFTSNQYCIDHENGILFLLERDEYGSFSSISQYSAIPAGDRLKVGRIEILSDSLIEELVSEAYGHVLNDTEEKFYIDSAYVTALEEKQGETVLKGEAYGHYYPIRECCHVDWEINTATGEKKASPHEKKIYDEEKDKEVFEACDKAFTEKDGGNWLELSDLKDWRSLVDWDSIQGYKEVGLWMRVDIDGDNLPELISVRGYEDDFILPINSIYTYIGAVMKPLDLVYWDPTDNSEFLYFGSTGNLIYEHCDSGQLTQGRFDWYQFDDCWDRERILQLEFDYFFEETDYSDKEEKQFLKERYPDTYGSRGAGCYYYKIGSKTSEERNDGDETQPEREEITLEEFLNEYKQITGFDFFEAYPYYDYT